jgi:hypothetical protein
MPLRQRALAILLSVGLIILIFELVRRRKLREEYSWLWMLTGVVVFVLATWHGLLLSISRLLGIALPASTIFLFGVFFLILINLYFSVKISTLATQVKELTQKQAILESSIGKSSRDRKKRQNSGLKE